MRIATGIAALAALSIHSIATAQSADPTNADLDQRLKILERKVENQADDAAAKAKDTSTATAGEKGFGIKGADGSYEIRFKGLLQADGRFYLGDPASGPTGKAGLNDGFTFRRIEPVIEASVGKLLYIKLQPQFAGDSASTADVFGELRFAPAFVVRGGKFKEPLGLESLQSSGALELNERGFPTELVAARDLGLQFGGDVLNGTTSYAIGLFNGAPDGRDSLASDVDNRKEGAARVWSEPFKNDYGFFRGLGFGIAASTGTKLSSASTILAFAGPTPTAKELATLSSTVAANTANFNAVLPRYRSPGQLTVFSYRNDTASATTTGTVVANGRHLRWTPQLYYYRNAFGLLGEYVVSKQVVALDAQQKEFQNKAYQALASYVLTGEDASYKGVKPGNPYTVGGDGWGAIEVVLRYGVLDTDDAAFAGVSAAGPTQSFADPSKSVSKARDEGVGVNWYLTSSARVSVSYDETKFTGGAGTFAAPTDRDREQVLFTRLQYSF